MVIEAAPRDAAVLTFAAAASWTTSVATSLVPSFVAPSVASFAVPFVAPFVASLAALTALFIGLAPIAAMAAPEQLLTQSYTQAWMRAGAARYGPPQQAELAATEALFVRLLEGQNPAALHDLARSGGWELRTQTRAGGTVVVVTELAPRGRGRGLYAFFGEGRHALQAPHVPTDQLTGDILRRYADDALPRAMAWNTVPRSVADLAHLEATDMIAFSMAFARVHPQERLIQLHGFDSASRKTAVAQASAAIVSAGHPEPSAELKDAVRCLKWKVEPSTRLYGDDVQELGGTTNAIGRALRTVGYVHFVHLELNRSLRERLLRDTGQRRLLFTCLGGQS